MKLSIPLSTLLIAGFVAASAEKASAVVYCQYVSYPAGCTVRPGVVLRPRPVARAAVTISGVHTAQVTNIAAEVAHNKVSRWKVTVKLTFQVKEQLHE